MCELRTFEDREALYERPGPIRCGMMTPSGLDAVADRMQSREECHIVVVTMIALCYDGLPVIEGPISRNTCFVAMVDNMTKTAYQSAASDRRLRKLIRPQTHIPWELILVEASTLPFSTFAKAPEIAKTSVLSLFPLAHYVLWLDGKAKVNNLAALMKTMSQNHLVYYARKHPHWSNPRHNQDVKQNQVVMEFGGSVQVVNRRFSPPLRELLLKEIDTQLKEYSREGFVEAVKSHNPPLKVVDICAGVLSSDPCSALYACAWHNEMCYHNHRGQNSNWYALLRAVGDSTLLVEDQRHFDSRDRHLQLCDFKSRVTGRVYE
jgi:hypothetical protein